MTILKRQLTKVGKSIGILVRIKTELHHVNADILLTIYLTLMEPYLECCNIIGTSEHTVHLTQLFIKEKKAIMS